MLTRRIAFIFSLTILVLAAFLPLQAQANWNVVKTFQVGGEGGWDYLTVDPTGHRLFVPRSTHTMVIDSETGNVLGDIPGQKIAHGVAVVPKVGRGFVSDGGGDGAIVVFDLKTYAVLGKIVAQPDVDGIIYDPDLDRVLAVSGDKGVLMTFKPGLDLSHDKIDQTIDLGGAPEFLASDGTGKVYINLMDKNVVAVVDLKASKVISDWPVAPGGAPVGMSMDAKKRILIIGCRGPQKLIVMSMDDGKVLSALSIGDGVDATKIEGDQIFASCRDGSLTVAREAFPGKFEISQVVKTRAGARTMGLDPTTHKIYLPTADMEEPKPGGKGRPQPKPGSFMIVVVAAEGA
jgi:DNA-binding beta-propeller fold protein YncE